ncbi:MAG: hypothetical protein ABWX84_15185 [Nocardioides sp.]
MNTQHRGPLFACLVLTLSCGLFLGNALRTQGFDSVISATRSYATHAAVAVPIRIDLDPSAQDGAPGSAAPVPPPAADVQPVQVTSAVDHSATPRGASPVRSQGKHQAHQKADKTDKTDKKAQGGKKAKKADKKKAKPQKAAQPARTVTPTQAARTPVTVPVTSRGGTWRDGSHGHRSSGQRSHGLRSHDQRSGGQRSHGRSHDGSHGRGHGNRR